MSSTLTAPSSSRQDLLSQIQAGKQLRSTQPDWQQIYDASAKTHYYYNVKTGESTWDAPADYIPAAGQSPAPNRGGGGVASGAGLGDALKASLDRYRTFVQDDEDCVQETANDWED